MCLKPRPLIDLTTSQFVVRLLLSAPYAMQYIYAEAFGLRTTERGRQPLNSSTQAQQ